MGRESIKKVSGAIIGYVDHESNGDKTVRELSGRILGYYRASRNVTTDITGRIVAQGDCAVAFLFCDLGRFAY